MKDGRGIIDEAKEYVDTEPGKYFHVVMAAKFSCISEERRRSGVFLLNDRFIVIRILFLDQHFPVAVLVRTDSFNDSLLLKISNVKFNCILRFSYRIGNFSSVYMWH